jgi:PAS domain S-box-containing protein
MNALTSDFQHAQTFFGGGGEMGERMRSLDWSKTPLGPPERWSQTLHMMVRLLLANRFPMLLWWGPQYVSIYNDAYRPILGTKHPWALALPVRECWSEIWHVLQPLIDTPYSGGPATWLEDLCVEINRHGFIEETHFTVAYSPVPDEAAPRSIGGVVAMVHETTEKVVDERRLRLLKDLGARPSATRNPEEACKDAADILARYATDVPFAALYLLDAKTGQLRLAAACGFGDADSAHLLDVNSFPFAREALRTQRVQVCEGLADWWPNVPAGPWSDPPATAMLLPIRSSKPDELAAVLLAGVSARLALNERYRDFFGLVAGQIATAIANAQAYEEERRRAEALAELDRAKTAFFSNVSHEFRTPLTLMLVPMQDALADHTLPNATRALLEVAYRNSQRLSKMVNSLLDFSRIEAGRLQATYELTDLAALTRDLASSFRSAIERAGLHYRVDCELAEPVYVDRDMWEKIVLNLLSNALKFTLQGEIAIALGKSNRSFAVLEVRDTGVGVPPDELPRLFDRFHRVESTHGRTHEGSGIGLALVQELAKLHGGTVSAHSELNVGTSFRVSIPLGAGHLPTEHVRATGALTSTAIGAQAFVQEALRWIPGPTSDTSPGPGLLAEDTTPGSHRRFASTFGARIVLADDNADMRAYVGELLRPHYNVELVADGQQALEAALRERPDLILSDVMMPNLDGFGLLATVRAHEDLRSVAVVLLSARAGEESIIEGLDAGADDYLIKPFSSRELLSRVGCLLELQRLRSQTEKALRQRTEQFQTLLNEAPLGVYLVDADFKIREVNPTARLVFGAIPDLIGRDFHEVMRILWPTAYADEIVQRSRHTLETGEYYATPETVGERLDLGVRQYYEWRINRIVLSDGQFGVVCYFRDITEHVLARTRLETADRQKDEFLAMLAHELRNPLAPIRNAGELLARSTDDNPRTQQVVGILRRQVSQLTRLVDDLLDVSRITQGRIELKCVPVQLSEIIEQALETVEPLVKLKRHKVSVISRGLPLCVNADPARLVQCVGNILTNAAKYTEGNGEIRVESHDEEHNAVLTVTDNGAGISAELLPHVFDLFVQADRTLDRALGGLGIGLSIVKRIVEMHGGRVRATSAGLGKGSSFEIRLPLMVRQGKPAVSSVRADAAPRVPLRILVVDDNEDSARSLAMILELEGHQVEPIYSSQHALERVELFAPDAVLLDIGLPDMNGYEVARRIRAMPQAAGVHLIALSGYGQAEDKENSRRVGFDNHLTKPVDFGTLHLVLAALSRRAS